MLERGARLGHYKILSPIGEGAVTEVYEAEDEQLRRRVALKLLQHRAAADPVVVERFKQEARALAAMSHQAIVPILQFGELGGRPYCTMPYLSGGNLRTQMEAGLDRPRGLQIMREVACALAYAHEHGLLHRDLKPENIQFSEQGDPSVSDFGLSRALRQDLDSSATSLAVEDPRYLSPEQARGYPEDARSDLYALGVILFEVLSGRTPFDDPDPLAVMLSHVSDPVPALSPESADLQPLLERLLAKDPVQRPDSARSVAEELLALAQTGRFDAQALAVARPTAAVAETQRARHRESMARLIAQARRDQQARLNRGPAADARGSVRQMGRRGLWAAALLLVLVLLLVF